MKFKVLFFALLFYPTWSHASENCEGAHIGGVLDSMAAKYKRAIGDTLVISESEYEWSAFSSLRRTPKLNPTGWATMESFEKLKEVFIEEALQIYPYYEDEGESPHTLRPYLLNISRDGFDLVSQYYPAGDKSRYKNLKKVMFKDFSQVWGIRVGMATIEEHLYPVSTATVVLFLVGQTACGRWVGLKTFVVAS